MKLLIVESPAKCKTISTYLGEDYFVESSIGHIRDLSIKGKGGFGVDIENNFTPEYVILKDKVDVVEKLRKKAEEADHVYLATDPDREGEAISWHLASVLGQPVKKVSRIVFNEITKSAILKSIKNDRQIDMKLVHSQESRRILDRIIGFRLSSLMQQKLGSKSAGRVQSVALKLVVDREKEIQAFEKVEYWDVVAKFLKQVGDKEVLLALSGGVDSSVVAALLIKAIGKKLHCVHVNHGLMRMGESEEVIEVFQNKLDANLIYVNATDRFLNKLENISDPEQKRKIIGTEFIRVFEEEARKLEGIEFLAQGTIYPDIVESGTKTMKNVKSHHNVGGLPDDLKFELVEPLKMLFKDEVRACGIALGLPETMVYRQPFPGPGLGVRCLGAITRDRLESLRLSDAILREEFKKCGLDKKVWQYFTVVPDFKSVGVKNNARSFEWPVIIRAVNTVDAMTASIEEIDYVVLHRITQRIINEVPGVNRVLYDLTPKPCGTIEWE